MIPATAVAIPTARTHRSPQRTTFTRSTYAIVRTPNVSAVYKDPYATVPSAEVSGAAFRRVATTGYGTAPTARSASGTAAFSTTYHHRRERQLQDKVDVMEAKNRDLENRLLDLRREMMMMKASNTSSSRLYAPQAADNNSRGRQRSTSSVPRHHQRSASAVAQRGAVLLSPPSRGAAAANRFSHAPSVEHTLHLVDELRDALIHGGGDHQVGSISTIPTASTTTKRTTKKRKASAKRSISAAEAGDQLKHAIDNETARFNSQRINDYYRQTSAAAQETRWEPTQTQARTQLRSPSRPVQRTTAISTSYDDHRQNLYRPAVGDDDEFESLQRSYWSQSQAILEQLDRKLKSLDVTHSN